jgi:hypothetical protein
MFNRQGGKGKGIPNTELNCGGEDVHIFSIESGMIGSFELEPVEQDVNHLSRCVEPIKETNSAHFASKLPEWVE